MGGKGKERPKPISIKHLFLKKLSHVNEIEKASPVYLSLSGSKRK